MVKMAVMLIMPILLLSLCGCGEQVDIDRTGLVRITDRVYAFVASGAEPKDGYGANSGFVVGGEAVLVVDSRYMPELAGELLAAVRSVTDLPIAYLVNTHYHPDHTWGNSVFRDEGARLISCPETDRLIEMYSPVYLEYYKRRAPDVYELLEEVRIVLPDSVIAGQITIDLGDVSVVVECVGAAHTAADCIVSVPADRVVFAGGILNSRYHPNLGDPGMDLGHWLSTLDELESRGFEYYVPAQGRVSTGEIVGEQRRYIRVLRERCRKAIGDGMTLETALREVRVPGTELYEQENLLAFNIQAIYRNEVLSVVRPPFRLLFPPGFAVVDGAGHTGAGLIRWVRESSRGRDEVEIQWQPTSRNEIIAQDLKDFLAEHLSRNPDLKMDTEGSKRVWIEEVNAQALYGVWRYGEGVGTSSGAWEWIVFKRGEALFTVRLSVSGGSSSGENMDGIVRLERLSATIRFDSE